MQVRQKTAEMNRLLLPKDNARCGKLINYGGSGYKIRIPCKDWAFMTFDFEAVDRSESLFSSTWYDD